MIAAACRFSRRISHAEAISAMALSALDGTRSGGVLRRALALKPDVVPGLPRRGNALCAWVGLTPRCRVSSKRAARAADAYAHGD